MSDALIFSGIFLALVLATQVGRRRHNVLLAVAPFVSCAVIGTLVIVTGSHTYTSGDILAGVLGSAVGISVGVALTAAMAVYRRTDTGKLYTRAGWGYLAIWLAVLCTRVAFIWLLQNVPSFGRVTADFLVRNDLTSDGVALFFLLMALAMVLTREVGVLVRAARIGRAAPSGEITASQPDDARMRA